MNTSIQEFPVSPSAHDYAKRYPFLVKVKKGGNDKQGTWLHRDLAIEFVRWLDVRFAIAFNKMVEEILLGHSAKTETLKRILLQVPSVWQKTFPDEFFAALLKCWCDETVMFNRAHGTPSFCGWFINKFIYEHLWVGLPQELKARRKEFSTDSDESLYKLHQFLTENAKSELHTHTAKVTGFLQLCQSKDSFKAAFNHVFLTPNQLGMKL